MGDALQVLLLGDPAAPYPYVSSLGVKDPNNRICQLTMWYSTAKEQSAVNYAYGMDRHGGETQAGKNAGVVFKKDADGKGYTLEALIPWARLHLPKGGLQAGDVISLMVRPIWGNATGTSEMISFQEIVGDSRNHAQGGINWGRAKFVEKQPISPRANPGLAGGGNLVVNPLQLKLTLDDPKAKIISLGLFDKEKGLIRSLPVVERRASQIGTDFEMNWDGLDADGRPIPPGRYELKQLTHEGIGQKFIASLHQSGNPPWKTDDGLGAWGGDWAPPIAAATDAKNVYLGWEFCEAGSSLVCVKRELDKDGMFQKLWGATPAYYDNVGISVVALAVNGERLFVGQDGRTRGGHKLQGKNVGDFHGPSVPQTDRGIDPDNPEHINVQMVEYGLDYNTGKYKCLTTLWRPNYDGWTPVDNFSRASRFVIRNYQGRQYGYLDHGAGDRLGSIFIRKGDRFQACASLGYTPCVPVMKQGGERDHHGMIPQPEQWLTPEQWKVVWDEKKKVFRHSNVMWHTWLDANDDGVVQPAELTLSLADQPTYSFRGVGDDLTLWGLNRDTI